VGDGKNFDCIFGFSVKGYVRNTINLSCAKILLTSVIYCELDLVIHLQMRNNGGREMHIEPYNVKERIGLA